MYRYLALIISLMILTFTATPHANAQATGCEEFQAAAGGGNCSLRSVYTGLHGKTCVFHPCGPEQKTITCDQYGCKGSGAISGIGPFPPPDVPFNPALNNTTGNDCIGCTKPHCNAAEQIIKLNHRQYEGAIMSAVSEEFDKHRKWLKEIFFQTQILPAMAHFSRQMTAIAMHQVFAIGQFFDADIQLNTQRNIQQLKIQAHNDYHPSQSLCTFGTSVRSLAASEQKTDLNQHALSSAQMARQLGTGGTPGYSNPDYDLYSRWTLFQETYCDPKNNNWREEANVRDESGLVPVCRPNAQTPADPHRVNADIDYLRLISQPRTLNADFTDTDQTDTETDIIALSQNLYGHDIQNRQIPEAALKIISNRSLYMERRPLVAKRQVAEHSFNSIVALKSSGSNGMSRPDRSTTTEDIPDTSKYLYQILKELGVSDERGSGASDGNESAAEELLGKNPSYYAQLEVLAKRIYQSPDFYVNLYDKPANIKRKAAALLAIERMLDQALLESQLRQEMAMSVLLSSEMELQGWDKIQRELTNN